MVTDSDVASPLPTIDEEETATFDDAGYSGGDKKLRSAHEQGMLSTTHCYNIRNKIKHEAEEKADPHVSKSVAACKNLLVKGVAACTTTASSVASPRSYNTRNEIKHGADEKSVPHFHASATDDASTDTEDTIERPCRCGVMTNPRMVALMALSSKSTQSPDNHMLAVPVKAATSTDADAAELATDDACEKFMTVLVQWSRMIRCRSIRGQVQVTAHASHEGITSLLCVGKGCLSVVGGAELDETLMCVPLLQYANVHLVPNFDNMFQISVLSQVADGIGHGIFVAVRNRSARDRWLASLSVITESKIDGWLHSPDMACEVERRLCMNAASGQVDLLRCSSIFEI
jgi:hypothetical protein